MDLTPTITLVSRAIAACDPSPEEWLVTPELFARLRDEGKSIQMRGDHDELEVIIIYGTRVRVMDAYRAVQ